MEWQTKEHRPVPKLSLVTERRCFPVLLADGWGDTRTEFSDNGNVTLIIHSANQRAGQEIRISGCTWADLVEQGTERLEKEC